MHLTQSSNLFQLLRFLHIKNSFVFKVLTCHKRAMKKILLALILLIAVSDVFAKETEESLKQGEFKGSSEASSVIVSGNSNTEAQSGKTSNTYAVSDLDLANIFGKYLRAVSGGTETNKAWEAGLRYERVFVVDLFSGFLQHKAEHDPYNGVFVQRDSSDIGGKYVIENSDDLNWSAELGYRSSDTYAIQGATRERVDFIRIYTEAKYKLTDTTTTKFWIEHLPNLKNSSENQTNAELSLAVVISKVFSLKSAYLVNRNDAVAAPFVKDTTTWTTALVADY